MPLDIRTVASEMAADLDSCEQLLLRSFRRWTLGLARSEPPALEATWSDLACSLGPDRAKPVLDSLSTLVFRLAGAARRVMRHHHPCCPRMTWDEWCLLVMVSACQRDKPAAAQKAASALVGAEAIEAVLDSAASLARALAGAGQTLPDRSAVFSLATASFAHLERGTIH
jgi:hypothetical protein